MSNITEKFYTTEEAAKILDVHPVTLSRYCREGKIGFYKIGRRRRFNDEEIQNFIERTYKGAENGGDNTADDPFGID